MKRVRFGRNNESVNLDDVSEHTPIFAKKDGILVGMVVHAGRKGWILMIGGPCGATGYHETRKGCLESGNEVGYYFFVA